MTLPLILILIKLRLRMRRINICVNLARSLLHQLWMPLRMSDVVVVYKVTIGGCTTHVGRVKA